MASQTSPDTPGISTLQRFRPDLQDGLKKSVLMSVGVFVMYLTVSPFIFMVWTSFWSTRAGNLDGHFTLANFISLYTNPYTYELFLNTFLVASGMLIGTMTFGVGLAWLFARTNLPTKGWMETMILSPYAVSGYVYAIIFAFILGPQMGFLNRFLMDTFGLAKAPFDIFSIWGIFFVLFVDNITSVYLLVVPAMRNMDPNLEEVSRIHGAGILSTMREVSLPIITPALSGAALLTFLKGLGLFSIIAILGLREKFFVITTQIWIVKARGIGEGQGFSSALATSLLVITAVLIWYHRKITKRKEDFMTITGEGFNPRQWDLGKFRWPIAGMLWVVFIMMWGVPLFFMVLVSLHPVWTGDPMLGQLTLDHYRTIAERPLIIRSVVNTLLIAVVGGLIGTILVTLFMYYTERTELPGRGVADFLSLTPKAAPGVILGLSFLFTYLWIGDFTGIYLNGSLTLMTLALITNYFPTSSRMAGGSIVQIHGDLEESARISGASWLQSMREVFLPLYKGTLGVLFLYLAIHFAKSVSIPIMLYSTGSEVVSVMIFQFWTQSANFEVVAAFATLAVGSVLAVLLVVRYFGIKFYEIA